MNSEMPEEFDALAPDGRIYRVIKHRGQIDTSTLDRRGSIPGLPEFRLEDGRHLNVVDDRTFQIVETGEKLTRER